MLEQTDTAFARAIQQNDSGNHNGAARHESPSPPTDPSSKTGKKKSRSANSLDSMIAQPGENKQVDTNTASESFEMSDSELMAFAPRPLTAEEMYHRAIAEEKARIDAMDAAKRKKKELRASQGRWPRLGRMFGSKVESLVEEG